MNTKIKRLTIPALWLVLMALSLQGWGQTPFTATYTFGADGNVASFVYNGTAYDGIEMGNIMKVGVATSGSTDNFRATQWPTGATNASDIFTGEVDLEKYIGFTIDAAEGYQFTVSSITFGIGRSGTGTRQSQWRGSSDTYASMLNNYTTLNAGLSNDGGILTNPDANSSWTGNVLTLGAAYEGLTSEAGFRIYLFNSESTAGTAGLQGPITISGTFELIPSGGPDNPTSFTASAASSSQIDLDATANAADNQIVVAFNSINTFGEPTGSYSVGNTITGGGTVHYVGVAANLTDHTGLSAGETVYYKAWSVDGSNTYSTGLVANATTLLEEPSNHLTNLLANAGTPAHSSIEIIWDDAVGGTIPSGYLLKANTTGTFTDPVDGTDPAVDTDLSDGEALVKVLAGVESHAFAGLLSSTTYYFKLWPYTNSGVHINYKTDGTVPTANAATDAAPPVVSNTINFDAATRWTAGTFALTSYASDHVYSENNWTFTGGPALRNGTANQDGVAGALGTYSWRLRDNTNVTWTATYTASLQPGDQFVSFGFDARRWDGSPSPAYTVAYSVNGGTDWTTATEIGTSGVLDNAGFDNSSNWKTFTQTVGSSFGLAANQFVVRLSATTGERIMVDNFTWGIGSAATATFTGSGNWSDVGNWSATPGSATSVTVNGTLAVNSNATIRNLTIDATRSISINANNSLTVTNTTTNNAGSAGLVIESDATGTGSLMHNTDNVPATMQRYITGSTNLASKYYHHVSVPLNSNVLSSQFNGSYLFSFNQGTQTWDQITQDNVTLNNNQGYMIFYPNTSNTYNFVGQLNNGAFVASTTTDAADEYSLIPNPYPSAIDWDAASGWTKTNLQDAIWIWNPVSQNYASYITGAGTNGGSRYIATGQAFFVKSSAASPVLSMDNNVRLHNAQAFFNTPINNQMLRVRAEANGFSDEAIVRFHADASLNFEMNLDVDKLRGNEVAPQLYTLSADARELSINSVPFAVENFIMPLNFESASEGEISFIFSELNTFEEGASMFLEDKTTGEMINILEQQSYSFNHTAGNDPDRFNLHFFGVTGLDDVIARGSHQIWSSDRKVYVNIPELNGQRASIEMFDVLGSRIFSSEGVMNSPAVVRAMNSGVAVVRVTAQGRVYTTKLFIQ